MAQFRRLIFGLLLLFAQGPANAAEQTPLTFEARVDEPVLLSEIIAIGGSQGEPITIELQGLRGDARLRALNAGRYEIEVAPDTSEAGNLSGQLLIRRPDGAVERAIPISGTVTPWIQARPIRLFLGSIGHGAAFEEVLNHSIDLISDDIPFDIVSVEFEGIARASWEVAPPNGEATSSKRLQVSFSGDAVAADLRFGALARKYILVQTTHPQARQLVIPVMGMLSVNTTGRDYSQYLYNGALRWEGQWFTPNLAAAFLVMVTLFACGIGAAIHARLVKYRWWCVATAVLFFPAMAVGSWYLAATYSRGGWIAMAAGIGILLVGTRSRWYPIGLAVIFVLSIALQPAGLDRASSTTAIGEDKSVSHRLLLWKGALQILAEHPWKGVGSGEFGKVFAKDYQLSTHKEEYTTAINDYLTFGAERGIVLLALSVGALVALLAAGFWLGWKGRNGFLVVCVAAATAFLICGWFSSIVFQFRPIYVPLIAGAGILVGIGWECWRRRAKLLHWLGAGVALWIGCSVAAGAVFGAASLWALQSHPRTSAVEIAGVSGLEVAPRTGGTKGAILYFADAGEAPDLIARSTLRALAYKGWRVFCFDVSPYASRALEQGTQIASSLRGPDSKLCVAGHRQGAQIAAGLAAKERFVALGCYLPRARVAFKDLSPVDLVSSIDEPTIFEAQEADAFRSAQHLSEIAAASSGSEGKTQFHMQKGTFEQTSPRWQEWIEDLDAFCSGNL